MTAHRKNGTGPARPVLSLGTRKPRAASDTRAGAKAGPTIKIKRAARAASATGAAPQAQERRLPARPPGDAPKHPPARRLPPAATGAPPPPAALKKRRAAAPAKAAKAPGVKPLADKPAEAHIAPHSAPEAGERKDSPAELKAPELSERQRRHLRGLAHALKPLVRLGSAGLTAAVAKETARALTDHELIKVKAQAADRQGRDALLEELARLTGSALVHRIGHIGVLYRPRPGLPKILIPD